MPTLTPSRVAIVLLTLSLVSFLWTWGFPQQFGQRPQPVIDHYDHKNVHSEPIIPAPSIASTSKHAVVPAPTPTLTFHADEHGPGQDDDHRWDDATAADPTRLPEATETSVAEYEEDGGRWQDKDKDKDSTAAVPTTLLTTATAYPTGANATNATVPANTPAAAPANTHNKFCKDVHGAPHVMVVVRTSKADMAEKLPAQLHGLLSCVPHFAIFSDHSGDMDGIPVHDALASIGSETKRIRDEFREYQLMHVDADHQPDTGKSQQLDKWKFLPMVYQAYRMNPDAKFYVFIEPDTSLSWTNLLQWVNRLDYRIPYYAGSPGFINGVQIAQRGSGIMLSQGALRRYANSYDDLYASKWEVDLRTGCCGDLALAQALGDAHVEFYSSWPLMQGEAPATLDYTKRHWCAPAVTWHHADAAALHDIWNVQKNWTATHGWETPLLYRDAFEAFVAPHIEAKKAAWDNLSQDTKIVAPEGRQKQLKEEVERSRQHAQGSDPDPDHATPPKSPTRFSEPPSVAPRTIPFPWTRNDDQKEVDWDKLAETFKEAGDSPTQCQKSCEAVEDCLQWRYASNKGDGECHLGKVLRLGRKTVEVDDKWTSGWVVGRVEKLKGEWACNKVGWEFYQ
jgi:hypothetical protein